MAFDAETYVDTWASGEIGMDPSEFDKLLFREHCNFMEVLVGADTSSGVPKSAAPTVASYSTNIRLVLVGLYDTLLMGYMRGYFDDDQYPVADFDPVIHRAGYSVIKLAIVVMADLVA
mmetsp:Transcript_149018/g.260408  ORF Transcript_149018/g.260408 Transcript_149018/m.260408 type:complete len:118 (-) Transcript_149018:127-480(-)